MRAKTKGAMEPSYCGFCGSHIIVGSSIEECCGEWFHESCYEPHVEHSHSSENE